MAIREFKREGVVIAVDADNSLLAVRTDEKTSTDRKREVALAFATLAGQLGPGSACEYVQMTRRQDSAYEQVWRLSSVHNEEKRQNEMRSLRRAIYVMNTGMRSPGWHEPE